MKSLLRWSLVVLACLVLVGCSGSSSDNAATIGDVTTTAPKAIKSKVREPLDQAQLDRALLSIADVPVGYEKKSGEVEPEPPTGCKGLDTLNGAFESAAVKGSVSYQQEGSGSFAGVGEEVFVHEDKASDFFENFVNGFAECTSIVDTSDSGTMRMTLAPLSVPKMGDDTFAIRISGTTYLGPVNVDVIVMRADDNIISVSNYALGPLESTQSYGVARRALEKVNEVAG